MACDLCCIRRAAVAVRQESSTLTFLVVPSFPLLRLSSCLFADVSTCEREHEERRYADG